MAAFRLQSLSPPRALKAARRKLRQAIEWVWRQEGSLLLGPGKGWPAGALLHHETLRQLGWDFTSRLLLGSAVVGVVLAPLSGLLCLRWLQRRQRAS